MICCYQVTKICSSRYGFAIASSAWGPLLFWSFYRSRNFGLEGNEYTHCAYPDPHVSLQSALKRLAAIPGSQNLTGRPVLSWFPFYCFLDFVGLDFNRLP